MHLPTLLHLTGGVLLAIAGLLLIPFGCTFLYNEPDWYALLLTIALSASMGIVLWLGFRKSQRLDELKAKEGFVLVAFCWIVTTVISTLPFVWHGSIPSFTEAFFEVMSGYTTTGATVLTDIEALPHGLLLWRTLTHFVGGMGVVVLYLTLFAGIGSSGLRLFQAEAAPGQSVGGRRLVPRVRETIRWLWRIYVGLHVIQIILLCAGGMPLFDAFIHATSTVATSGFSNRNGSLGAYGSAYFEWVCIVFMLLGGLDFTLQHKCLVGRWKTVWQSTELKAYFGIVLVLGLGTSLVLWTQNTHGSLLDALRYGFFQVVSILTTTGLVTDDYSQWPEAAQALIFVCLFIGACAGSTTSGLRIIHFVLIWRHIQLALRHAIQPRSVHPVRVSGETIAPSILGAALGYFALNILYVLVGGVLMTLLSKMDWWSAFNSVMATLWNIGPAFGMVGPTANFGHISDAGTWFLSFTMLAGRLDIYALLVLFHPAFWRR